MAIRRADAKRLKRARRLKQGSESFGKAPVLGVKTRVFCLQAACSTAAHSTTPPAGVVL